MRLALTLLKIIHLSCASVNNFTRTLFAKYDKTLSPYYFTWSPVTVTIRVPWVVLNDISEDTQLATWSYALSYSWYDPRLIFDPDELNGEQFIYLPTDMLWSPRFSIYNSVETRLLNDGDTLDAKIEATGNITIRLILYSRTLCSINVALLPYDTQLCGIMLCNALQSINHYRLQADEDFNTDSSGGSEFVLTNLTTVRVNYSIGDESFDQVYFIATLMRETVYYALVVVTPTTLISALTVTGMLLPNSHSDDNHVINVAMASMLAHSITLGVVADTVPRTTNIPLLGYFVLMCLAVCSASLVLSLSLSVLKRRVKVYRQHLPMAFYFCAFICPPNLRARCTKKEDVVASKAVDRLYMLAFVLMEATLFTFVGLFVSFDPKPTVPGWPVEPKAAA